MTWDAVTFTAWFDIGQIEARQYQLEILSSIESDAELPLDSAYISYDVVITNIGEDDIKGPMLLLLDPGRYFAGQIDGADAGSANQANLWLLNISEALAAAGGRLSVDATLAAQTVTVVRLSLFATQAGMQDLVKANLGHGVYAYPQDNTGPSSFRVELDVKSTM